ncbi:efflux RND transporter permease subunit [Fibrivirga algicola]|jgi:multidrug efflux pump subunit AcrB|uniref:Efflux RND transporter permease subunit n=1 Tax=Fibrivirga algicola TaxID=2950420 RepID=A0ABX0QS66_9BACT|nr:efflux RND transporter permease subunit [Fibrivirga algicola]NID13603.1 efflux RND transporter permease subunit [Fibrivirga algicola]
MSLLSTSLKRPIAVLVVVAGMVVFSVLAAMRIPIDIFPRLNSPTIYVIEPYGGMSPAQMEGFFATRMQDQFLYIGGIKEIQSKNTQGLTIVKLAFYEGTDMAQASAEVAIQVNRAMKFFPPGALPPQVVRYDASSVPIGDLVFSSKTRPLREIHEMASTRIRPLFSTVPGLTAPPPIGTNARTVVINLDPQKIRSLNISPDEVVEALAANNAMTPSGNIRIDNSTYITTLNSLEDQVEDFGQIPVVTKGHRSVFLHDVATIADASDVTAGYALVNGSRSSYIPVVKTADASTWDVVTRLKAKLPEMRSLLPDDIEVSYEFDQSVFVINAVKSLLFEGGLGAILTGLMVLLFLGDWRSSLIVIITIPISVVAAVLLLGLAGQTVNIMTLSGLALSIGILVDQATVTIENIHQHLEMGKTKQQAIYDACKEVALPLLLILLCILAVFAPSFIMTGVPRAMFLPLSLSIGFAMTVSYFLAQSLVPVLANWLLKSHPHPVAHAPNDVPDSEITVPKKPGLFDRIRSGFVHQTEGLLRRNKLIIATYFVAVLVLAGLGFAFIGKDMLPQLNAGQMVIRMKTPDGTRLERTEERVKQLTALVDDVTDGNLAVSSAYVGVVPTNYATTNLYVSTTGPNDAVIKVALNKEYHANMQAVKERIREAVVKQFPDLTLSFEPADLTEKLMSGGAATPIEVQVAGRDMKQIEAYARQVVAGLSEVDYLRDVRIVQPLKFPVINITLDRQKLAMMGLNLQQVARSITASTSSSRFTEKNQWLDARSAYTYQVQVQIPEYAMSDMTQLGEVPLVAGQVRPVLSDVATFSVDTLPGEYDRTGPRRFVTVSANIHGRDLGTATRAVEQTLTDLGETPKGLVTQVKGMSSLLTETLDSLQTGLGIAVLVIFLLLAANYQSFKLSFVVLSTVPAVLVGAIGLLLLTGSTLNLQSYMGIIMSVGISVANAILIVTNAERLRWEYRDVNRAAVDSVGVRLRPVLMTTFAMIAGMVPMALGTGEAGEQVAPLGRAVIGGLIASTLAALYIVPQVYVWLQRSTPFNDPSLLPTESAYAVQMADDTADQFNNQQAQTEAYENHRI